MRISDTKLYHVWTAMKSRCYRKKDVGYCNYGARGITVCDEWKHNFMAFQDWAMANGFQEGLTLDRKDVNGNYCPENCRWATRKEQMCNRRNTIYVEYDGQTVPLSYLCEQHGVTLANAREKLKKGYSLDKILDSRPAVSWGEHVKRLEREKENEISMLLQYLSENPNSTNKKTAAFMGCSIRKVQRMKAELKAARIEIVTVL